MEPIIYSLIFYALWTLIMVVLIGSQRTFLTLFSGRQANSFKTTGEDVSPFANRLTRVHGNCFENLPIFATIVLAASLTGKTSLLNPLAYWFLFFRVAQSLVHLTSTSELMVKIRFFFFLSQLIVQGIWIFLLLKP